MEQTDTDHSRFTHSVGTRSRFGYRQIRIRMSSQRRSLQDARSVALSRPDFYITTGVF
jgi:hypothetical protein